MVLSILEANVPPSKWDEIITAFRHATALLPPQMCESLLVQAVDDPQRWNIITIWHNKRHIRLIQDTLRRCGAGEIFRSIGIEPVQSLFNVIAEARETDLGSDLAETPVSDTLVVIEDEY
ncbi:MAG: hypothetical protein GYA15_10815 [Leptolinea sp.]|jgi:hypothetical protein|nr:hypothetical protein [Leptolinea sp.]